MPAPTALKKADDAPLPVDVDIPMPQGTRTPESPWCMYLREDLLENEGMETEFVLDQSDDQPVDMDAVLQPMKDNEDAMAIDEEGRPRFAPSRDIVRFGLTCFEARGKN